MTDLLIILILIGLGLYGAKEYYQIKQGVIPKTTPESAIAALADLLSRSADAGSVVELSSGYGGSVLGLAERLPDWDITGIEHCITHWIISNMRTIGRKTANYRFFWKDSSTWNLDDFDVVFINQETSILKRWEAGLARRLAPEALLITYQNALPRAKAIDTITVKGHVFYLYRKANSSTRPVQPPPLPIHVSDDAVNPESDMPPYDDVPSYEETSREPELPINPA